MDIHIIAYIIGIAIVVATHIYILSNESTFKMKLHAQLNIAAAIFIAYYFAFKENIIRF